MPVSDFLGFLHVSLLGVVEVFDNAFHNIQASVVGVKPSRHLGHVAGKKVLITGGTSGIGEYTAKALIEHGANVVITSRSLPRAQEVASRLAREVSTDERATGKVWGMKLDLGSIDDVKRCAKEIKHADDLDILICNAGIMCPLQHQLTGDHMEVQFQTNHLGHFVLASEIAAHRVRQAAASQRQAALKPLRLVIVSSVASRAGRLHWTDLQFRASYVPFRAYAQSKLANLMCAEELQRRSDSLQRRLRGSLSEEAPPLVTCTTLHPGLVNTPLARTYFETDYIPLPWLRPVLAPVMRALFPLALLRPELSVRTVALAAAGPAAEVRGRFVEGGRAGPQVAAAGSGRECARLWDVSLDLAQMRDPFL